MVIKNMDTWDEFLFDISTEDVLIYQLEYDKENNTLNFMVLPNINSTTIRDFGNNTFQPDEMVIDTKYEVLRVFDKITKGIYSFDISKLDFYKVRKYKAISRPHTTNYKASSDKVVMDYGEDFIMSLNIES